MGKVGKKKYGMRETQSERSKEIEKKKRNGWGTGKGEKKYGKREKQKERKKINGWRDGLR